MKKKTVALVLSLVMAASLLTACGSSSSSSSSSSDDAAEEEAEEEEAEEEEAEEEEAEEEEAEEEEAEEEEAEAGEETAEEETVTYDNVTLTVFDAHAYGQDEYEEMAAAFEESHPGVTVAFEHVVNDGTTVLQSRVNSGEIPDVFDVESGTNAQLYYEYAYDWSNDTDVLELFHEDAIDTGRDEDGNVMSLPWTYETMALLYNVDVFEDAGITSLPTTVDELEEVCIQLQDAGYTPIALAAKETWVLAQLATQFIIDKDLGATGTEEALESGELTFADLPNWDNLFKFLDLAMEYGPDKPLEIDWETSENLLANNQAGIIEMGDWCQSVIDGFNEDANIAIMPGPVGDGAEDTVVMSNCNWTYIVNKDSENLELAKEYAVYILTSEMGQYWMCEGVGAVPGAITEKEVVGDLANSASTYISAGETEGWIHTIAPNGYSDTCGPYLQAYMLGEMTQDEVTQAFQEFYDSAS